VLQEIVVVILVLACAAWLGILAFRFFRPRPNGKLCGGGCCDAQAPTPAPTSGERVIMISSDDLRARVKARQG